MGQKRYLRDFLRFSNACVVFSVHTHSVSFFKRCVKLCVCADKLAIYLDRYWMAPRNDFSSFSLPFWKKNSSKLIAFSMWPCFLNYPISFSIDCCRWIGIGLVFCCISFASFFSCVFTSIPFTVWFC